MRRSVKIILILAVALLAILGSLHLYFFVFGGLEKFINNEIASLIDPQYKLEIFIKEIEGNLLSGVIIKDISVRYVDADRSYLLADIKKLSASYSLKNLWQKRYVFNDILVDSAVITLMKDSTGKWLAPDFSPGEPTDTPGEKLSLSIGKLILNQTFITTIELGDTAKVENINLSAALTVDEGTYSVSVDKFEFVTNQEHFEFNALDGKLTYSEEALLFKDVSVTSGEMRAKASGFLSLEDKLTGSVTFAADNVDLKKVTAYIGPNLKGIMDLNGSVLFGEGVIEGKVDLAGSISIFNFRNLYTGFRYEDKHLYFDTLYGTILDDCAIDGSGEIDFSNKPEKYYLNSRIKNFNLKRLVQNSFESDLTGFLVLEGESFRSKTMRLNIQTDLFESSFDEYPLHKASGSMVITTDSLYFGEYFRVNYYENVFYVKGFLDYSGGMELDVKSYLNNLDRWQGKLFIDKPGGRGYGEAKLTGRTNDPDLTGYIHSDSIWIYGLYCDSLNASFDIERFLTGKRGEVSMTCFNGKAWDIPYDTGYMHLQIDSNLVKFDSLYMLDNYTYMNTKGVLDYGAYPQVLVGDTLLLRVFDQPFYNQGSVIVAIDSVGYDFKQAKIGNEGALLAVNGRVDYDESMTLVTHVDHVPAGSWINLFEKEWPLDGIISFEAELGGNFLKPEFDFVGRVDSLVYRDLVLGDLTTHLQYKNSILVIDSFKITSEMGEYLADGSMYVNLALTTDSLERFPDLPLDVHITAVDKRFDLVSLIMPTVEQLDGDFVADITLSGTPMEPHLEGGAYIKNTRLKYFDLEQPLFSDSAAVSMENNRIIIDNIEIYTSKKRKDYDRANIDEKNKRYAYLDGEIVVKSLKNFYYDVDVTLPKEFPFTYELDDIQGVVEGELHIEGDTPPLVTGDLTLLSTRYQVNFSEANEGSPIMTALSGDNTWDLNINIDILSNYWIKNDDLDAELSGQVNLIRNRGLYRFIGEMEILRGKGFLFDKTFRLEPGSRVIFEGKDTLNPQLDIIGYTNITTTSNSIYEDEKSYDQLTVRIHVTGTLEKPEINPAEDSDVENREELLPLIVANYYSSENGTATTGIEQRLTGYVSSQVSQIGTRQLGQLGIGVETFEIDPYYEGAIDLAKTRVTLGFYTVPNLYVYGRSAISGQSGQEVGFEYRVNKNVIFEGRRDEDELYRLLMKLHWEFK